MSTRPLLLALLLTGCAEAPQEPAQVANPHAAPAPTAAPPHAAPPHGAPPHGDAAAPAATAQQPGHSGQAAEVLEGGGYTYVRLQNNGQEFWIAGPQTAVKVGDTVQAPVGSAMNNFNSPTLNRTFPSIDLVQTIQVVDGKATAAAPVAASGPSTAQPGPEGVAVQKLDGGQTVAELWTSRATLAGKPVAVRARVVKFTANILGTNFLHVQDGSGDSQAATHDITVTSKGEARVGDVVVLRGTLVENRDYGRGYSYPLLIDEAQLTQE